MLQGMGGTHSDDWSGFPPERSVRACVRACVCVCVCVDKALQPCNQEAASVRINVKTRRTVEWKDEGIRDVSEVMVLIHQLGWPTSGFLIL